MKITSGSWSRAIAVAAASIGLLGLGGAAAAKDIIWARYGDIDTLDPQKATSTLLLQVWSLIYDTLLATDKDGQPVPNLASPGRRTTPAPNIPSSSTMASSVMTARHSTPTT